MQARSRRILTHSGFADAMPFCQGVSSPCNLAEERFPMILEKQLCAILRVRVILPNPLKSSLALLCNKASASERNEASWEGMCKRVLAMKAQAVCLETSLLVSGLSQGLAQSSSLSVKGGQEGFREVGGCLRACVQARNNGHMSHLGNHI